MKEKDIDHRQPILCWLDKGLKERAAPIAQLPVPEHWTQLLKAIDAAGDESGKPLAPDSAKQ